MRLSTLSAHLMVGFEQVDWSRDAASLPYGYFLSDLSPRTDHWLRYCTKTESILSKFYLPDQLTQSKLLDDEHTKFFYSPGVPFLFSKMQKSSPSVLSRRVFTVSLRMHGMFSQRKPAKHKQISHKKLQNEVHLLSLKISKWRQRREVLAPEEGPRLIKVVTFAAINHLSWHGTVCPRSFFCIQQQVFEYSQSYKAGSSKESSREKSDVQNRFTWKGKKTVCQSRLSARENFVLSWYQALEFAQNKLGRCGNWGFRCQIMLNNSDVKTQTFQPFILLYLTLLVYLQLWLWIEMPKPKREEAGSLPKYERQNQYNLYTWGGWQPISFKGEIFKFKIFVQKIYYWYA